MLPVEYVRSLNCNYERMLLEQKPEEKKYQYCILSRGGIKGLLLCDLRYINGNAYLYYDISSKQNVEQLYSGGGRSIHREWILDFLWSMRQIQKELERFLLDMQNLIWLPNQVFQDLETKAYSLLYIPYYDGEATFGKFMDFLLEHLNYEDEGLVECVYHMNEEWERCGEDYLKNKIFEDAKELEKSVVAEPIAVEETMQSSGGEDINADVGMVRNTVEKKGLFGILDAKKNRNKKMREDYRAAMQREMQGYAVAEQTAYGVDVSVEDEEEEYGKTIYIEEKELRGTQKCRLFATDGSLIVTLEKNSLSIGKKKDEVDLALEDNSVSRLHARIIIEQGVAYLEDLNSTNGTFKNGLRMRPYEKRRLDQGDEIKCGKVVMIFRY